MREITEDEAEIIEEYLEFTDKQMKALKELKKAFKKCARLGIEFWDNYGTFTAYNGRKMTKPIPDDIFDFKYGNFNGGIYNGGNFYMGIYDSGVYYGTPTQIKGLYSLNFSLNVSGPDTIRIGCKNHTVDEWKEKLDEYSADYGLEKELTDHLLGLLNYFTFPEAEKEA